MTHRLGIYTNAEFEQVANLICRVPNNSLDRKILLRELHELLSTMDLLPGFTSRSLDWHDLSEKDLAAAQMAKAFSRISIAENPLDPKVCIQQVKPFFSAKIRNRWSARWKKSGRTEEPSLVSLNWETLSGDEQYELRMMARDLAVYYQSKVRRGRQQKTNIDTLLLGLAEIWSNQIGYCGELVALPYSRNSRFIQFVVLVAKPLFAYFENSKSALSRRWERIVRQERGSLN